MINMVSRQYELHESISCNYRQLIQGRTFAWSYLYSTLVFLFLIDFWFLTLFILADFKSFIVNSEMISVVLVVVYQRNTALRKYRLT